MSGDRKQDVPVGGLGELDLAEGPSRQQVEHEPVDLRPNRLHDVERERLAGLGVEMDQAESRVQTDHLAGEDRLGLDERVDVVEERVHGPLGLAVRFRRREHRPAPLSNRDQCGGIRCRSLAANIGSHSARPDQAAK